MRECRGSFRKKPVSRKRVACIHGYGPPYTIDTRPSEEYVRHQLQILNADNVSLLEDLIEERRSVPFANVDAFELGYWKIPYPLSDLKL
jgi:hypothetical protein